MSLGRLLALPLERHRYKFVQCLQVERTLVQGQRQGNVPGLLTDFAAACEQPSGTGADIGLRSMQGYLRDVAKYRVGELNMNPNLAALRKALEPATAAASTGKMPPDSAQ